MSALSRSVQATLLFIGTIIGVGMFGIPFVFTRSGVLVGALELLVLTAAMIGVHLAYGDIVAGSRVLRHLPGYVTRILGVGAGRIAELSHVTGLVGALLAYLVIGGSFLGVLLRDVAPWLPAWVGVVAFYAIGIAVISRNIRGEGVTNALLTLGLIAVLLGLSVAVMPHVEGFESSHPTEFFAPYGVVLFALAGAAVLPDVRRLLGSREPSRFRSVIVAGTLIPAAIYLMFAVAVSGATGAATTPDAVTGLAEHFGNRYALVGGLVGFLAAITSFIGIGLTLEGVCITDFQVPPRRALLLTATLPALLYVLGLDDFITIISVVGALAVGTDAILILLAHRRFVAGRPASRIILLAEPVRVAIIALFSFGVIYELTRFFNG